MSRLEQLYADFESHLLSTPAEAASEIRELLQVDGLLPRTCTATHSNEDSNNRMEVERLSALRLLLDAATACARYREQYALRLVHAAAHRKGPTSDDQATTNEMTPVGSLVMVAQVPL
jgi:hypothetical protein